MLLELTIKDFAIIDSLHLRLHRLFNVFTGETGAGKSIIIDAVNALLGGKIGVDFVRAGCERATVEGIFSIDPLPTIADEWQAFELAPVAASNGATTLFEAMNSTEMRDSDGGERLIASHADANSADA